MKIRLALASDHAGYDLKICLRDYLKSLGHAVLDLGGRSRTRPDDYPDFAAALGRAVVTGAVERGVLICGSGVGVSVAANKIAGIRAAVCHDAYSAHQGVEHDDMNVLVLGSRVVGRELAKDLVSIYLRASFSNEPRHRRRLAKVRAMELNFDPSLLMRGTKK